MGLFKKLGNILFDEEIEEVPVDSNDLSDKNGKKKKTMGFIDHTDSHIEEDTITEVKVPVEEEPKIVPQIEKSEEIVSQPVRSFKLPSDDEFDNIPIKEEHKEVVRESTNNLTNTQPISRVNRFNSEPTKQTSSLSDLEPRKNYRVEQPKPKLYEEKDYKNILNDDKLKNSKKPFHVTPVISPVYGILDKNYKPEEVVKRTNITPPINAFTTFSSVNVDPGTPKVSLKENLFDINSEINEMMNDSSNLEEELPSKVLEKDEEVEVKRESRVNKIDIEDAFDTTSEMEQIHEENVPTKEMERVVEEKVEDPLPVVEEDEVINNEIEDEIVIDNGEDVINNETDDNESEEDKNLENTIETDLFNLINSMYSNDDEEEDE